MTAVRRLVVAGVAAVCLLTAALRTAAFAQAPVDAAPAPAPAAPATTPAAQTPAVAPPAPALDVTLFRIFLKDGSFVVSYGEYARTSSEVVVSMPLGTDLRNPTLQLVTIAGDSVDWSRTERYAQSVRYQQYVQTRAEDDFAVLSTEVAAMLNEIAATTDRQRALAIADQARRHLAAWPSDHLGYRAADVAEIVSLIDQATSRLGGGSGGASAIQLSLVASPPPVALEPVLGLPSPRDQVRRLVTLAASSRPTERIEMLRSALKLMDDPASGISREESGELRRSIESQIREEMSIDADYGQMTTRLMGLAQKAAVKARVVDVERVIDSVADEDAKLGGKRPDTVRALRAELEAKLDATRDFRLRQDQWTVRRGLYQAYIDRISAQVAQLVKAQPSLDAIRRLSGPTPKRLQSLQKTLAGGTERLERVRPPEQLRATHEVLVSAWRFAESAAEVRQKAIAAGDMSTAWRASSAAAGAIMLLSRAQQEMRSALEPPTLK